MATQFDVTAFGAAGDGVTDDTSAIQAAIDAAAAAGGGTVTVPAATYRVSPGENENGACLLLKGNVALAGAGMGASVIRLADGLGYVTGLLRGGGDNIAVSNLTLDGNGAALSGAVEAFSLNGSSQVALTAVEAMNASSHGFDLRGPGSSVVVRGCVAHHNAGDGMVADGLANGVLADNTAYLNQGSGYRLGGAVQLLDSDAYSNAGEGIRLVPGAGGPATVDGGRVYSNAGDGVHLEGVEGFKVNGLDVYGNGAYGINVDSSHNGQVSFNRVHANALEGPLAEVRITGTGLMVRGNIVTGAEGVGGGIVEPSGAGDYNTVTDNVVSQAFNNVTVQGVHSQASGNRAFIFTNGTGAADSLAGTLAREQLFGHDGADRLAGEGNADVLVGGAGSDRLSGGEGADVFRYTLATDSYRTSTQSHADRLLDFDPAQDRLDLTALGYTGVGNGYSGTLRVLYNPGTGLTYLKSLAADSNGERFELALAGDYSALTTSSFQPMQRGGSQADSLHGTAVADSLYGQGGRDTLYGEGGDDLIAGGSGGDVLHGGEGADTFVFSQLSDSLRTASVSDDPERDTLIDFNGAEGDLIDVSALNYYALGDGLYGTLKLSVNAAGTRTVLKSLIEDHNGKHFEIVLNGDYSNSLTAANFIFTHPQGDRVYSSAPTEANDYRGLPNRDFLKGLSGDDILRGASGNDRLEGGTGDDVLIGGAGADRLTGDSGADVFRYNSVSESDRSQGGLTVDTLTDFAAYRDVLDLRSLSFTGLGDGHDGTLQLSYNPSLNRTYLTDLDGDAQGRHFQLRLIGDLAGSLSDANLMVAAEPVGLLGSPQEEMA